MQNAYLLTGEPRIGKTTIIKKIVNNDVFKHRMGGFITQEVMTKGERTGFEIITLDGQKYLIADINFDKKFSVGKYGVDVKKLETVGIQAITRAIELGKLIVIDEIGPMQLLSDNLRDAIIQALESRCVIIGTIVQRSFQWTDNLKKDKRISILTVTLENRDHIAEVLVEKILEKLSTI